MDRHLQERRRQDTRKSIESCCRRNLSSSAQANMLWTSGESKGVTCYWLLHRHTAWFTFLKETAFSRHSCNRKSTAGWTVRWNKYWPRSLFYCSFLMSCRSRVCFTIIPSPCWRSVFRFHYFPFLLRSAESFSWLLQRHSRRIDNEPAKGQEGRIQKVLAHRSRFHGCVLEADSLELVFA